MTQPNAQIQSTSTAEALVAEIATNKPELQNLLTYLESKNCSITTKAFGFELGKAPSPSLFNVQTPDESNFTIFPHYAETLGNGSTVAYSIADYFISEDAFDEIGYKIRKMATIPNSICDCLVGHHPINFTVKH